MEDFIVTWGIIVFVAFVALAAWLLYASRPKQPADALAIRLAADLGATQPTLVDDGLSQWWRFALPRDPGITVLVAGEHVLLRRTPRGAITHAATLLTGPLAGRDQEMYASRTVVPDEGGDLMIGGHPNAALEGWELRLNAAIIDRMRDLGLPYVQVEHEAISTGIGVAEHVDAEDVLEIADFLGHLEALLVQQLH